MVKIFQSAFDRSGSDFCRRVVIAMENFSDFFQAVSAQNFPRGVGRFPYSGTIVNQHRDGAQVDQERWRGLNELGCCKEESCFIQLIPAGTNILLAS